MSIWCSLKFISSPILKPAEYNKAIVPRCLRFLVTCESLIISSWDKTEGNIFDFLGLSSFKDSIVQFGWYFTNNFKALINCLCELILYFFAIITVSINFSISLLFSLSIDFGWVKSIKSAKKTKICHYSAFAITLSS